MRSYLLLVLLFFVPYHVFAQAIADESNSTLCDLSSEWTAVPRGDAKGRAVEEFAGRLYPDGQVTFCLNTSDRYRIAHSDTLVLGGLGVVLGHIVQFNANFFSEAPLSVLRAVAAHELVHRRDVDDARDGNDCMNQLAMSVVAYTHCELKVDIRAAAIDGIGKCSMLESLRFMQQYWKRVAPKELTVLGERIAWFEEHSTCQGN